MYNFGCPRQFPSSLFFDFLLLRIPKMTNMSLFFIIITNYKNLKNGNNRHFCPKIVTSKAKKIKNPTRSFLLLIGVHFDQIWNL